MVRVWGGEQTRRCPLTKQRVKTLLVNHSSLREVQPQHIKNKNYPGKVSFLFATRQLNPFLVVGYGGEAELPTAIKAEMPAGMDMLHGQALPLLRWACAQLTSHVLLFATPWTVACQAPLSDSVWPHRRQPPGSSVPRILQARTLEWVAISFSNACMHAKSLQSCPTLCDPMDSSPSGSSVHRIL